MTQALLTIEPIEANLGVNWSLQNHIEKLTSVPQWIFQAAWFQCPRYEYQLRSGYLCLPRSALKRNFFYFDKICVTGCTVIFTNCSATSNDNIVKMTFSFQSVWKQFATFQSTTIHAACIWLCHRAGRNFNTETVFSSMSSLVTIAQSKRYIFHRPLCRVILWCHG